MDYTYQALTAQPVWSPLIDVVTSKEHGIEKRISLPSNTTDPH